MIGIAVVLSQQSFQKRHDIDHVYYSYSLVISKLTILTLQIDLCRCKKRNMQFMRSNAMDSGCIFQFKKAKTRGLAVGFLDCGFSFSFFHSKNKFGSMTLQDTSQYVIIY